VGSLYLYRSRLPPAPAADGAVGLFEPPKNQAIAWIMDPSKPTLAEAPGTAHKGLFARPSSQPLLQAMLKSTGREGHGDTSDDRHIRWT
jgi:hypothetical protein